MGQNRQPPKWIKIHGLKTENNWIRLTPWHHNSNNLLLGANLLWPLAANYYNPHPDPCPTSSASLLLSSSSRASRMHAETAAFHCKITETDARKGDRNLWKKLQKTCSAERWWNIVTCICTVLQFEHKWDLAPDAGVILIVFFVASICPQDITGCHVAISTNT